MPSLVLVGAQWGDEAKGKMADVLGESADVVVRFSGGNNAGHTIIFDGEEFKLHLLPAGILREGMTNILGAGMAICPKSLLEEWDGVRGRLTPGTLAISPAAHCVMPYHKLIDQLEEEARGDDRIGTTSRGIGPMYTDKVQRIGIRMGELVDPRAFRERLGSVLHFKNRLIELLGGKPISFEALYDEYAGYAERLRPMVADTDSLMQEAIKRDDRILFEGAQGTMLDLDSGTYPFVTSSHPVAGGACLGTGIGPRNIDRVLGVCKSYTTRVGSGPMPTEFEGPEAEHIQKVGHEFGTTTGRARRIGWLDLKVVQHSCAVNSLDGLILTRLDVLSGLEQVRLGVGYEVEGKDLRGLPVHPREWTAAQPVYETVKGWDADLQSIRSYDDLPGAAKHYIEMIEDFCQTPTAILSIGPDREETIIRRRDLTWG